MTEGARVYVLDTGPLSHFARSQWLGVLKLVLADGRCVIPDLVAEELQQGQTEHGYLAEVLNATWIEQI